MSPALPRNCCPTCAAQITGFEIRHADGRPFTALTARERLVPSTVAALLPCGHTVDRKTIIRTGDAFLVAPGA